jgi:hypothetical protein
MGEYPVMNEADGTDEAIHDSLKQSLITAARVAETLSRARQKSLRQREQQNTQIAHEAQARAAAERAAVQGVLARIHKDQWWNHAQPDDIARVHALAEGWKDHDPAAFAASERIRTEVRRRYGIDTRDIGKDAAYLESGIETINAEQSRLPPAVWRNTGMAWPSSPQRRPKNSVSKPGRLDRKRLRGNPILRGASRRTRHPGSSAGHS